MAVAKMAGAGAPEEAGALFVAATPIGNLNDVSTRLKATLERVSGVVAEDTRRSRKLLHSLGIRVAMVSLHAHNERSRISELLGRLLSGEDLALMSDAGTPGISDPGMRLVREARQSGIRVTPLPGPCAAVAALSVAGFPADRFHFEGFLPSRQAARRSRLKQIKAVPETLVFYEAVHRLTAALQDMREVFGGERKAFLARELTKIHESTHGGTLADLCRKAASGKIVLKGEFTLVLGGDGGPDGDEAALDSILTALLEELPTRQAARLGAKLTRTPRRVAYSRALELQVRE
ncbi:MAG: 16S rRNA (cytidine(1402)-2'-O)-methyltransferase [Gammaproteobacteria bacterium]|nr:16S rRNA (cytidine(1402)-2'-O)-methyltransferase [Gammaproteobacteria bacterium]